MLKHLCRAATTLGVFNYVNIREMQSAKAAKGAATTELDASINNCRRLNETLLLIIYALSKSLWAIGAASKHTP